MLSLRLPFLLFALLIALPSGFAMADDDDFPDPDGLLETDGSEKKKPVPEVDPNAKMAKKVEENRKACEARLNEFQSRSGKLLDVDEKVQEATSKLSDAVYVYAEKHGAALENYRNFHQAGDQKSIKKYAKMIKKLRTKFLKVIKSVNKDLVKIEKLEKKLLKAMAAEDAEAEGEE